MLYSMTGMPVVPGRSKHMLLAAFVIGILIATGGSPASSAAADRPTTHRASLEVETGAIWQSRNEIHIPDTSQGTRFDLGNLQGSDPDVHLRIELTWNVSRRHALRIVYAPISFAGTGAFATPVSFAGSVFAPNVPTDSDYRFDSYRFTYRYLFHESDRWRWRIGATVFIRDADVELRQPNAVASDSNVGAVPLLSANMEYVIAPRWIALVDFDGLISPQGRALDVAAKIRYDLNDTWYVTAGYRVFEGGVDNDERFAFGWYNVAVVSLGVRY
ncbi:MAG TPA: hypothetical protein VLE46_14905 [Nitrospira sp.]|nr:hypothetical protein [Nitrospira sp.]